jgi:threonine ammonia-lyase medium form
MATQVLPVSLADIERAAERLRSVAIYTPLLRSYPLSDMFGAELYLKAESLQRTGSFKFRGAYNALSSLTPEERARGVITYSSGNHGQAVAAAAQLLGIPAIIVMPENAIATKIEGVRRYGAQTMFAGLTSTEREVAACELAAREGYVVIPPFDDARIIAGQGTIGLELLAQNHELDTVLVPVGGGGLISGIAIALKSMQPAVRVFGVEPAGGADAYESLRQGRPVTLPKIETIADGLRTSRIGDLNFAIMSQLLDGILLVEDEVLYDAIRLLALTVKLIVEPSGAIAVAALLSGKLDVRGCHVATVLSGGNIDPSLLAQVISTSEAV